MTISGGIVNAKSIGNGGNGFAGGAINGGNGGTVTITGGTVTVDEIAKGGLGRNGGQNGADGTFSTGTSGNAVIYTKSFPDSTNRDALRGIIFEDAVGTVYCGNNEMVTPVSDFAIPSTYTLTIPALKGITLSHGIVLFNEGELLNKGNFINDAGDIGGVVNKATGVITDEGIYNGDGAVSDQGTIYPNIIFDEPEDETVYQQSYQSLFAKAKASFGKSIIGYQWYKSTGEAIEDEDKYYYAPSSQELGKTSYYCIAKSNNNVSKQSRTATYTVIPYVHDAINPPNPDRPIDLTKDLVLTFEGTIHAVKGMTLNGKALTLTHTLDESLEISGWPGYTGILGKAKQGSVVVTIYKEFLQTLPSGKYTLELSFEDGVQGNLKSTAGVSFTVLQPKQEPEMKDNQGIKAPQTGDQTQIGIWSVGLISMMGLLVILISRRARREKD